MVISLGSTPGEAAALCVDNERQAIQYAGSWSADGRVLTFASVSAGSGPRFRLTYTVAAPDTLAVSFEIAPPSCAAFKTYVGGTMKRVGGK